MADQTFYGQPMRAYTIVKNEERYPGIAKRFPHDFAVVGLTLEQTVLLAEQMSNHETGCDYAFYCKEDPEATS